MAIKVKDCISHLPLQLGVACDNILANEMRANRKNIFQVPVLRRQPTCPPLLLFSLPLPSFFSLVFCAGWNVVMMAGTEAAILDRADGSLTYGMSEKSQILALRLRYGQEIKFSLKSLQF